MNAPTVAPPFASQPALRTRLSLMMFLQYAIWGAWLPLMYQYLKNHLQFSDGEIGYIFMIGGIGAVLAPFIAGQIADRYFNSEKFLGISHILGGILVWQLSWIDQYAMFFAFSLLYSLIYSPTLALTNSISLHHLPDRDRDFGKVRLWGTIGWIAVGIAIGQWLAHWHVPANADEAERTAAVALGIKDAFRLSAILGIVMGLYAFTLPRTPPSRSNEAFATAKAISQVRFQPLLTLFLIALPISCIHQFYFVHTSAFLGSYQSQVGSVSDSINAVFGVGGGGLMTIGQMSEILVLGLIPILAKVLSRKTLLLAGIAAYALRMALFAYVQNLPGDPLIWLTLGVALHGVCFGCFIFVAFMIVDEETTADVRASAQSLFGLVVFGVGIIIGSVIAGSVGDWAGSGADRYTKLFSVPMWAAVACFGIMLLAYPGRRHKPRFPD